ncbi:serine/threonine-protein kinase [Agromyces sp. SYSU T0242]|uniref:serine/threonine-protein kinase n=1 Tax=Agromyces litoreus TaxID=3158561 RepID=UPI0033986DFD
MNGSSPQADPGPRDGVGVTGVGVRTDPTLRADPAIRTDPTLRADARAMPVVPSPTPTPLPPSSPVVGDAVSGTPATFGGTPEPAPRYEFLEHIGSGGMADVYRARDHELGRHVAVKLFRETDETPADRQRREREITLLSGLTHIGLVPVHDAGVLVHAGVERRYLVMELVEGRSLAHRIVEGPVKPRQVADIGAQVADVLSYVHERGVIHRDIKPENILVNDVPTFGYTLMTRLADFGVAQFVGGTRLTGDGTIMGTAAYISPEQARGAEVTPATDIYSLGLVLLEALKGDREYTGTPIEAALARLHRAPEVPEDLEPEWRSILAAMTADDPALRPNAHDVSSTMRDLIRMMIVETNVRKGRVPTWAKAAVAKGSDARARTTGITGIVLGALGVGIAIVVGIAASVGAL